MSNAHNKQKPVNWKERCGKLKKITGIYLKDVPIKVT
jgi:hypothetical protein